MFDHQLFGYWQLAAPIIVAWLLTYAIHSTIFLSIVWLLTKWSILQANRLQDLLWKVAVIGGVVTASVQLVGGVTPVLGQLTLAHHSPVMPNQMEIAQSVILDGEGSTYSSTTNNSSQTNSSDDKPMSNQNSISGSESEPLSEVRPHLHLNHSAPADVMLTSLSPVRGDFVFNWLDAVVLVWFVGIGIAGIRFSLTQLRLRKQLLKHRRSLISGPLPQILADLCRAAGIRQPIRLTHSSDVASPFALKNEICLPDLVLTKLSLEQQRSILAHEVSHIIRRDPMWLFILNLLQCLFFFQPLNYVARRRLQEIAEYLCDDWTVQQTRNGLTLAKCLAEVASWGQDTPRSATLLSHVTGDTSLLVRRVRRLVNERATLDLVETFRLWWLLPVASLLLFVGCGAPGIASPTATPSVLSSIVPANPTSNNNAATSQITSTTVTPSSSPTISLANPSPNDTALPQNLDTEAQVSQWLQTHAIPFETTVPNDDFEDLMPLKEIIGDARIVALGEATQGTHEFFQMKHRLFAFLVQEMGFTTLAIESNWPEVELVNGYVQTGQGSLENHRKRLIGLYQTQEVIEMVDWMKSYNQNLETESKVSFAGLLVWRSPLAKKEIKAYLQQVDPSQVSQFLTAYGCIELSGNAYPYMPPTYQDDCREKLQAVYDNLVQHQTDYEQISSPEAFALALQSSRIILQYEDIYKHIDGDPMKLFALNERYMAENVSWLLEQGGPESKIVLWTHNIRVGRNWSAINAKTMGDHLKEMYQDDMVAMGFLFYRGDFRAFNMYENVEHKPSGDVFQAPLPQTGDYEAYFHQANLPRFFLDLRDKGTVSPLPEWLATPRPLRNIRSGYSHTLTDPRIAFSTTNLSQTFDAIIYLENTSPSIWMEE